MSNELDKVLEKDKKRYIFLKALYELTSGNTGKVVGLREIAKETGLSEVDLDEAYDYLLEERLVKAPISFNSGFTISHIGVVEFEHSIKHPNRDTEHFPFIVFQQIIMGQVANITNPGGISQSISGGKVGSVQASQGDNNSQQAEINITQTSSETQLNRADIIKLLTDIEQTLQASDLSVDTREETITYLNAAKKASEQEVPKKNVVAINLKGMAETLEDASKATDSAKKIWETIKPILSQLPTWLGVAKTFFEF